MPSVWTCQPEESSAGLGSAKNDASRSSGGSGGGGEGLMQEMNALLARRSVWVCTLALIHLYIADNEQ